MAKLTGGGPQGNKTKSMKAGWKVEPKSKAIDPAAVSAMGMAVQFKKPNLESGPGYTTKAQPPTGIANARQGPASAAPGGMGRMIYKSGSQSPTPAPKPVGPTRDTLGEFGPEISGPGRRR
jgi:hypothetical protein